MCALEDTFFFGPANGGERERDFFTSLILALLLLNCFYFKNTPLPLKHHHSHRVDTCHVGGDVLVKSPATNTAAFETHSMP